ncbi:hypothetical protein BTM393_04750 [Helicobacter pylori]
MNATNLETYAALQKPSHVFGNYAVKTEKEGSKDNKESVPKEKGGNSGSQTSQ